MPVATKDFKPLMDWVATKLPDNADYYPVIYARLYPGTERSHDRYYYGGYVNYDEARIGIRKFIPADFQGWLMEYGPPNIASAQVLFTIGLLVPSVEFTIFNLTDPNYGAVDGTTDIKLNPEPPNSFLRSLHFSAHPDNLEKHYDLYLDMGLRQKLHLGSSVFTPSKAPRPHVP